MLIVGMDEVGRGAFAGPLVASAVRPKISLAAIKQKLGKVLRDSKLLSAVQREKVVRETSPFVNYRITAITVSEINYYGLGWANIEIFRRLGRLLPNHKYVIDGNLRFEEGNFKSIIKADGKVTQVILAGIFAKYFRDLYMHHLHLKYPHYGWNTNAGYGTKKHRQAIEHFGPTPEHRKLFIDHLYSKQIGLD